MYLWSRATAKLDMATLLRMTKRNSPSIVLTTSTVVEVRHIVVLLTASTDETKQDVLKVVVTSGGMVVRLSENVVVNELDVTSSYSVNVGVGVHAINSTTGNPKREGAGDGGEKRRAICGQWCPVRADSSSRRSSTALPRGSED